MICPHFGICGGCRAYKNYDFNTYTTEIAERILGGESSAPIVFASPKKGFRARADFRFCTYEGFYFATNAFGKNERTKITQCPILLEPIQILIKHIREILAPLSATHTLRCKLYGCSFLSTYKACVVTFIYHKCLDTTWQEEIHTLKERLTHIIQESYADFEIHIIGRSRGQKISFGSECIIDNFGIYLDRDSKDLLEQRGINLTQCTISKKESLFSQPNPFINAKMLYFLLTALPQIMPNSMQTDLVELYCGSGNFTIPLSQIFRRVFATEVVKDSIHTLQETIQSHNITNITLARLNAQESIAALCRQREFFRLKDVDLDSFDFGAILIDPPRSGVGDEAMLEFIARFRVIVYISCAPQTLCDDLRVLKRTHTIHTLALFEQFPYTHHIESICILTR
ncbi:MAG: tRNA (uridine(54)-C5)-methyltransferase TrmA [Helicobacter sp.]|nr:tRNA (uridine(54)-C5)-methyltransferase TrmA [Helicobacter sp.]